MTNTQQHGAAPVGVVYLLHFDQPYRHASHYTGWTTDLPTRLAEHTAGRGARLLTVIAAAGIGWQLARTWPTSTRARERALKRQGGASRRCPICATARTVAEARTGRERDVVRAARNRPHTGAGVEHDTATNSHVRTSADATAAVTGTSGTSGAAAAAPTGASGSAAGECATGARSSSRPLRAPQRRIDGGRVGERVGEPVSAQRSGGVAC